MSASMPDPNPPTPPTPDQALLEQYREALEDFLRFQVRLRHWYENVTLHHSAEIGAAIFGGALVGIMVSVLVWLVVFALRGGCR